MASHPPANGSEVPTTPSLGAINLLEQLTQLRETSGRDAEGRYAEKASNFHTLPGAPCSLKLQMLTNQPISTPNPSLLGVDGGLIT